MKGNRVLFFRIEPTSYIVALSRVLQEQWQGRLETVYLRRSITQSWSEWDDMPFRVLSQNGEFAAVRDMLSNDPPDLIHCAGWGTSAFRLAIRQAHRASIPVVVDLDTWKDAARGPKALLKKFLLPHFLRKITHFAPGGQRQAGFLRRYGVDPSRITPVNMTVDVVGIRRFLRAHPDAGPEFRKRMNLPTDSPVVLFLARLVPEKGITDLLQAWATVTCRLPNAHLVFVGDGELMPVVKAASSDRLHALGRLSGEDVWRAYAAADVFVSPSHSEGWGLTVNEAMAADVPVIMTDAFGCIGDLAVHDVTACILPVARPDLLAKALERALTDHVWRNRLRTGARERIVDWTLEAQAHRITRIWQACLNR